MAKAPANNAIHQPHDSAFKIAMLNYEVARDFFESHLPDSVKEYIDLSVLEIQQETFLDASLSKSACDLLYRTLFVFDKVEEGYLYILAEHQSQADFWLPRRMLEYQLRIWDKHKKQKPHAKKLPLIVPLIFYTGAKRYDCTTNFLDYFKPYQILASNLLLGPHKLVDLSVMRDEEILQHRFAGLMEIIMKNVQDKDLNGLAEDIYGFCLYINQHESFEDDSYINRMIYYFFKMTDPSKHEKVIAMINEKFPSSSITEKFVSTADYLEQKGREKGIQQERIVLAKRLLQKGMDVAEVASLTSLSIDEIRAVMHEMENA